MTDDDLVDLMNQSPDPAFVASELAAETEMTVEAVRNRLDDLAEEGRIHKKKRGRTVLWWTKQAHESCAFRA